MSTIGDERLVLPVEHNLPLDHYLVLGATQIAGSTSTLVRRPDGYWVEPVAQRDPVYLNGQPLTQPARLTPGDVMQLGPLELRFSLE